MKRAGGKGRKVGLMQGARQELLHVCKQLTIDYWLKRCLGKINLTATCKDN